MDLPVPDLGLSGITIVGLSGVTLLLTTVALVVAIYAAYLGYTKNDTNQIMHLVLGFLFGPFYLGYMVYQRGSIQGLKP